MSKIHNLMIQRNRTNGKKCKKRILQPRQVYTGKNKIQAIIYPYPYTNKQIH